MDDKENLFYKPDLQPDRNYRSEAIIEEVDVPEIVEVDVPPTVVEQFEEIKEVLEFLPTEIVPTVDGIVDRIIERAKIVFPNGETTVDPLEPEIHDPDQDVVPDISIVDNISDNISDIVVVDDTIDDGLPDLFPGPTDIKIEVLLPKSLVDIARDTYKRDTIDLKEDYLKKLQTVMQRYLQGMVMIMSETGVGDIKMLTKKYDGDAVNIPKSNLRHLGDFIVRSQIAREQKSRFFKKTHNEDQTLMHMRAWHAAEQQRERYYGEDYGDSESYLNSQSNGLLRESRAMYDKKYNRTLYDMYKYLNGSVMIIDDTLQMSLKEAHAKGVLLKNGVNIFATTESVKVAAKSASPAANSTEASTDNSAKPTTVDSAGLETMIKQKHAAFMAYVEPIKAEVIRKGSMLMELWNYVQTGAVSTLTPKLTPEEVKSAANYNQLAAGWETAFSVSKDVIAKLNGYNATTYLLTIDALKSAGAQAEAQATSEYENHKNRIETVLSNWSTIRTQALSIFETFD